MVTPDFTTRTCTKCGTTYPLTKEYFQPRSQSPSGYMWRCRNCVRVEQRKYSKRRDRARVNAYRRNHYSQLISELENNRVRDLPSTDGEVWMVVKCNKRYEVSSSGRVRSTKVSPKFPTGRVLRPNTHGNGYVRIPLYDNGTCRLHWIHRLVAEAFLGDAPSPAHQVNHIDGDKANNHLSNLEYVTPSENKLHSIHVLKRKSKWLPESMRRAIWTDYKSGTYTKAELSRIYGVSWMTVHNAINRYERIAPDIAKE